MHYDPSPARTAGTPPEALSDPRATFTSVPAPAVIELCIQPTCVVRLHAAGGRADFRQRGHTLTTVGGQENVAPVIFGEPGESVIGRSCRTKLEEWRLSKDLTSVWSFNAGNIPACCTSRSD